MKKISDRTLGYLSILVILGLILFVAVKIHLEDSRGRTQIIIEFEEVGALQPQDKVRENGVPVGQVASVDYKDGKAFVTVKLDLPVMSYCEGTTFKNENFSLMGGRMISIRPVKDGKPLNLDIPQKGVYEPGIAEGLALLAEVNEHLKALHILIERLAHGSETSPSLIKKFNGLILATDQTLKTLDHLAKRIGPELNGILRSGQKLTRSAIQIADSVQYLTTSLITTGTDVIAKLENAVNTADQVIATSNTHITTLEKHQVWKQLTDNQKLYTQSLEILAKLEGVITLMRDRRGDSTIFKGKVGNMLDLMNFNIFGPTAREKRQKK